MKNLFVFTSLFLFGLLSCGDDTTVDLPACVDAELQTFLGEACPGASGLELWRFRGQDVYCFNYGSCNGAGIAEIFDANCNFLCTLGGADNNTLCDGDEWSTSAVFIEILVEN